MARRTQIYRLMPWVGGVNTSVDPGVLNPQQLVQADNVQFSSTGARIKREALEYLDLEFSSPDFRASSGTTKTLKWTSDVLVSTILGDARLVFGEKITITGNTNYNSVEVSVTSVSSAAAVSSVTTVADVSGSLNNKYFLLSAGDPGIDYYVWFNVNSAGIDPGVVGRTPIEVAVSTNATAIAVATALNSAVNAEADFSSSRLSNVVTVTNDLTGYAKSIAAGTSGFTVSTTTPGSYSITYETETSYSESETAANIEVNRASAVIMAKDYWRFTDGNNEALLVYATNNFQLFQLDQSGYRQQILGQEQVTEVVCGAASTLTTSDYFLLNGSNNENNAYVWYRKNGTGVDPLISARTGILVDIVTGDSATAVATATQTAINLTANFSATRTTATLTITNAIAGVCDPAVDQNTGFGITVITYGATLPLNSVSTIRTNVFNERLQIYFSGIGNYPIIYNPDDNVKYQLMGQNPVEGLTMPDASFAFNFLGRVWTNDKVNKDYLHFCETFDETLWLGFGDSGALPVNPGDGDPEGITNAYPYKEFIVVAKKDTRSRIQGDSPENFQVQAISNGLGNEGSLSVPVDESDVIFISRRGIHSQQVTDAYGDTTANYLSSDIKPTFNSFEPASLKLVQGAYIPELNSVALSIQESNDHSPNSIWLFNTAVQAPNSEHGGAWYRWPNISCTALTRRFVNDVHKLVIGTANGRVVQAQRTNHYADFGEDGILFKIKTGAIYPGQDPHMMKSFKRITMIYRPRGNFSFAVQAKIDNHQSQGFAFNETSGLDLLGETFILGTSLLGSSKVLAPFSFTMDGVGRGVTLTISQPSADEQIEVWGFAIEWENADIQQEVQ